MRGHGHQHQAAGLVVFFLSIGHALAGPPLPFTGPESVEQFDLGSPSYLSAPEKWKTCPVSVVKQATLGGTPLVMEVRTCPAVDRLGETLLSIRIDGHTEPSFSVSLGDWVEAPPYLALEIPVSRPALLPITRDDASVQYFCFLAMTKRGGPRCLPVRNVERSASAVKIRKGESFGCVSWRVMEPCTSGEGLCLQTTLSHGDCKFETVALVEVPLRRVGDLLIAGKARRIKYVEPEP